MRLQGFTTVEYVGPDKDSPEDHLATVGSLGWTFSINPLYGGKKVAIVSALAANVLTDTKNYERIPDEPTMNAMEWFWSEIQKRGAEVSEFLLNHYNPEPVPTVPEIPIESAPVAPVEPEVEFAPKLPTPDLSAEVVPEPTVETPDTSVEIASETDETLTDN